MIHVGLKNKRQDNVSNLCCEACGQKYKRQHHMSSMCCETCGLKNKRTRDQREHRDGIGKSYDVRTYAVYMCIYIYIYIYIYVY